MFPTIVISLVVIAFFAGCFLYGFRSAGGKFKRDTRPLEESVHIDGLGELIWDKEEESWLLPVPEPIKMNLFVGGDWSDEKDVIQPHARLIARAKTILEDPREFRHSLLNFLDGLEDKDLQAGKRAELKERKIDALRLSIDSSGRELGTLSFDCSSDRHYYIDYEDGEPGMLGCDG